MKYMRDWNNARKMYSCQKMLNAVDFGVIQDNMKNIYDILEERYLELQSWDDISKDFGYWHKNAKSFLVMDTESLTVRICGMELDEKNEKNFHIYIDVSDTVKKKFFSGDLLFSDFVAFYSKDIREKRSLSSKDLYIVKNDVEDVVSIVDKFANMIILYISFLERGYKYSKEDAKITKNISFKKSGVWKRIPESKVGYVVTLLKDNLIEDGISVVSGESDISLYEEGEEKPFVSIFINHKKDIYIAFSGISLELVEYYYHKVLAGLNIIEKFVKDGSKVCSLAKKTIKKVGTVLSKEGDFNSSIISLFILNAKDIIKEYKELESMRDNSELFFNRILLEDFVKNIHDNGVMGQFVRNNIANVLESLESKDLTLRYKFYLQKLVTAVFKSIYGNERQPGNTIELASKRKLEDLSDYIITGEKLDALIDSIRKEDSNVDYIDDIIDDLNEEELDGLGENEDLVGDFFPKKQKADKENIGYYVDNSVDYFREYYKKTEDIDWLYVMIEYDSIISYIDFAIARNFTSFLNSEHKEKFRLAYYDWWLEEDINNLSKNKEIDLIKYYYISPNQEKQWSKFCILFKKDLELKIKLQMELEGVPITVKQLLIYLGYDKYGFYDYLLKEIFETKNFISNEDIEKQILSLLN